MKVVCVGGGPAGLYFAILAKLANREHDITIIERNPAGVTYGWGVVFWEDLLQSLYRSDPRVLARLQRRLSAGISRKCTSGDSGRSTLAGTVSVSGGIACSKS